jgi:hypothetical protein
MTSDELLSGATTTKPKVKLSADELLSGVKSPVVGQPQTPNTYGASFRASPTDSPQIAGLKSLGNVPSSFFGIGKGILDIVRNPRETLSSMAGVVRGAAGAGARKLVEDTPLEKYTSPVNQDEQQFALVADYMKQRYGSLENFQRTATEDPAGVGLDVLGVLTGGAGLTGRAATLDKVISATAKPVTVGTSKIASGAGNLATETAGFATSQLTGLSRDTISTITKNPQEFNAAQQTGRTRVDLADDVLTAVSKAKEDLSDLGSGYDAIRQAETPISLPEGWLSPTFQKYGLKFQGGRVVADKSSKTRNIADINAIQNFVENWGDSQTLTPNEYLNMRHDLAELAKYDTSGKSTVARQFGQDLREGLLNSKDVRGQVPGLEDLDSKYSAEREFLDQIQKDYIDPKTQQLKDGAASKLVNNVNAANTQRLARIEKFYPGFTKQAKLIKALEDVEASSGIKVGTYTRAGVVVGQAVTGNIPTAIITAIISQPEVAVPILKGLGYTNQQLGGVIRTIRSVGSDINNLRFPMLIQEELERRYPGGIPMGLSVEDVSKIPKKVTPASIARDMAGEDIFKVREILKDPSIIEIDPALKQMLVDMRLDKADTNTLMRFLKDVDIEYTQRWEGTDAPGIIRQSTNPDTPATPDEWTGTPSSKPSTVENTSTSKKPSDMAGGSKPSTAMSGGGIEATAAKMKAEGKTFEEFVKAQGKPLLHGGPETINEFKNMGERGVYLTPNNKMASIHAGGDGKITEAFITPKKVYKIPKGDDLYAGGDNDILIEGPQNFPDEIKRLKAEGYDAIRSSDGRQLLVFEPSSVKTRSQLESIWKSANR